MSTLKSIWPTPFKIKKGDVASLIIQLVIFVGWVISLLSAIPVLGLIFKLVGALVEIYGIVGIVLCVLVFVGVL